MVAVFVRSSAIFPLAAALAYCAARANTIGIIPSKRNVPFVVPSQTTSRPFARRRFVPILNEAHLLLLRGGDLDESDYGRECSQELEPLDENEIRLQSVDGNESNILDQHINKASKNGIASDDDAWAEEIKRLQMYLSSPQSKMSPAQASNVNSIQQSENSNTYGTGEDVLEENDPNDGHLKFDQSFDAAQPDTLSTSTVQSGLDDEENALFLDVEADGNDCEIHETPENVGILALDQNEIQEVGNDGTTDDSPNEVEFDVDVADPFDRYEDEIDLDVEDDENTLADADEGHEEETAVGALDAKVEQAGSDSSDIDVTKDSSSNFVTLTDTKEDSDDPCNQLEGDRPESMDPWEAAPAVAVAESNRLVEEGLSKLRRKNGEQPSVPYVITRAMKRVLVDELGYDEQEVQSMRPDVAVVVVSESLRRPSVPTLPSGFYNEDIMPLIKNELPHQFGLQHKIRSFLARLDFKQYSIMLGSILTVSYSLVSKVTIGAGDKQPERHENDEKKHPNVSSNNIVDNESFGANNEALLQNDLDRTWLDRLISMLTFYK
eukprot:CCRYP_004290-RA/>CCRYP_004290-RA protein AED:0.38 eAED:1.00 QI:0/0/0/1/0/0.5/2/0/549